MKDNEHHENLIKNNPHCVPIPISKSEPCYGGTIDCMHYAKPMHAFQQCNISAAPSAPINFHTPYLDFELLYNDKSLKHLANNKGFFDVKNPSKMKEILVGFDDRSGQLPGLFFFLITFAEVHNIIINDFQKILPNTPSSIQQSILETRKAITAIFQKLMVDALLSIIPGSF
jgi:hypothetical protein